jgi:hypothetical protein
MSHFYGTLRGNRGEATRCGTQNSGMETWAASWSGAIRVVLWYDGENKVNKYQVCEHPWHGIGTTKLLAEGIFNE